MFLRGTGIKLGVAALAVSSLVACGGGSDSSAGITGGVSGVAAKAEDVAGPLDALQDPLSNEVVGALAAAAEGTPLSPVLSCVDQAVVIDLLDVVDSLALAAQEGATSGDPAAAMQGAAENIVGALQGFATNATAMLQGLAGGAGCGEGSDEGGMPSFGLPGGETGTPLDAILAQLSGFGDIGVPSFPGGDDGDTGGDTGSDGQVPGLSELAAGVEEAVAQFNSAYALFEQQVPAEALNAPVFGGVLSLVYASVNQLDDIFNAAASGVPADVGIEATTLVSLVVNALLTEVLPVDALEDALGQNPVSDAIAQGSALVGEQIGGGIETLLSALPTDSILSDPFGMGGSPLDLILAPLMDAVAGGGGAPAIPVLPSGGSGGSPTEALDVVLNPLLNGLGLNEPLDVLKLVNPVISAVLPFALRLPNALAGEGPFGFLGGPLGAGLTPVLEGLQPLQDLVDGLGVSGALNTLLIAVLNEALGAVL